jgi:hypothetical protein
VSGVCVGSACSSFDASTAADAATSDAGDGGDGSVLSSVEPTDGGATDATTGAVDARGACTSLVSDTFEEPDASLGAWVSEGAAKLESGEVELVPARGSQTGALWRVLPNVLDGGRIHAAFTVDIPENPDGGDADGITFAWSTAGAPLSLGGTGGDLGICNAGNEAQVFVVNTFQKQLEIRSVDNGCNVHGSVPYASVFGKHPVDITVGGGQITGTFGSYPFSFTLSPQGPIGAIGFTAATGSAWTRHAVDDVRVEWCP